MKRLNKKGFTLIELLAVIVVLAIVAAVSMTVIVPMISGQANKGAETSAKELNKQVANACSASGSTTAYGKFEAATYYTDNTKATPATAAACAGDGCYIELSNDDATNFVKGMNISGDMPTHVKMTVKNCQVQTACIDYTTGQFAGLKVDTATNGSVTSTDGTC